MIHKIKTKLQSIRDLFFYITRPEKNIVIILSSQRSGSTLLKALLAEGGDVSHLPEVDYENFYRGTGRYGFYRQVYNLSPKRIICLKMPYRFWESTETKTFPDLPNIKLIVLTRDIYGVVPSLIKRHKDTEFSAWKPEAFIDYWCGTYENILESVKKTNTEVCFIRYEDLIASPVEKTKFLFEFIGSSRAEGVDNYKQPETFDFQFGIGDGSENIKSLKVQCHCEESRTLSLRGGEADEAIFSSARVQSLREIFGYTTVIAGSEAAKQSSDQALTFI